MLERLTIASVLSEPFCSMLSTDKHRNEEKTRKVALSSILLNKLYDYYIYSNNVYIITIFYYI